MSRTAVVVTAVLVWIVGMFLVIGVVGPLVWPMGVIGYVIYYALALVLGAGVGHFGTVAYYEAPSKSDTK